MMRKTAAIVAAVLLVALAAFGGKFWGESIGQGVQGANQNVANAQ